MGSALMASRSFHEVMAVASCGILPVRYAGLVASIKNFFSGGGSGIVG